MKSAFFAFLSIPAIAACQGAGLGRLPPVVIELYDRAKPGGVVEIEAERDGRIVEIEQELYHVKLLRDNTTYKVELSADGVVRRTVREQRAELEVPLR